MNAHKWRHSSRTRTDPEGLQSGLYDAFAELSAIGRCTEEALTAELMDCKPTARGAVAAISQPAQSGGPAVGARRAVPTLRAIRGVGPVTPLTFSTAIDDPRCFRRSRDLFAHFGVSSRRWQ